MNINKLILRLFIVQCVVVTLITLIAYSTYIHEFVGGGFIVFGFYILFIVITATVLIHISKNESISTKELIRAKQKLNEQNQELEYLTGIDTLTGLPNRFHLERQVEYIIANASKNKSSFFVISLDLEHFKKVNDTLGQDVGDSLLIEVGIRLKKAVRKNDMVSRVGSDEFIIVLVDVFDKDEVPQVVQKLLNTLKEEIMISEHKVQISSNIGISLYPDDSTDFTELTKYADTAMYKAKKLGRDNFNFYAKEFD